MQMPGRGQEHGKILSRELPEGARQQRKPGCLSPRSSAPNPQKGSRPHRVRPIPRRRVPRKTRNESGTAEEQNPLSLTVRDKGFFN